MSHHQHHQGMLVLKHVSDLQTSFGLSCCGCPCRSLAPPRNQGDLCRCCYHEAKDIHRNQQPDKPKSVFDYFYEQLYSDKKETGVECNQRHQSNGNYVSVDTKPLCPGIGVPHVSLAQANSWNSRNEKDRFAPCLGSFTKKLVFKKECNFLVKSQHVDNRKVESGRCQRQLNKVPTTVGISLGYFEVYLAQETPSEEDVEKRKDFLRENNVGLANSDGNMCGEAMNDWKEKGKSRDLIRKKPSSQRHGQSRPSRSPRNQTRVPEAIASFSSSTRCTDRCNRLKCDGCVAQKLQRTKEPVNQEIKLPFSRYRTESRSRSRSTYQSRSISRSRSKSSSRSSSSQSSRRCMRSSTVNSRSCRPSETEPHSRSRSPFHHSVRISSSRGTSRNKNRSTRSTSRSTSRSTNQTVRSAARDRSARSPSIRRRTGSPCHLDKRRITSARRRPIAYRRAVSPSSSSSGSSSTSTGSSSASSVLSSSIQSSRISGSDSSFSWCSRPSVSSTNCRSSSQSSRSLLQKRSNYSRKNSHKLRQRLQRNLVPLMPSTSYTAKYSSA